MTARLADMFARLRAEGRVGVMPFLTVGYPDFETSVSIAKAMVEGGASGLELGIAFSDPLADGPAVQRSSYEALRHGAHPSDAIEMVRRLRADGVTVPLILMGYYNTFLAMGEERFIAEAAEAGADGLIISDLPPEEADDALAQCQKWGLALVFLAAQTSDDRRLEEIARRATGFIYAVAVLGVTGARDRLSGERPGFLQRLRAKTELPLVVGFGISKREHVLALRGLADAVAVGAAIVDTIEASPRDECVERVRNYVEVLTGRTEAST
jgi:tryptophan synthase alpha chain